MKLVYYTMPYSQLAQDQLSKFIHYCEENGIGYRIFDLKFITNPNELIALKLHGIPTIRRDDDEKGEHKEVFGKFNKIDLETLCAEDILQE